MQYIDVAMIRSDTLPRIYPRTFIVSHTPLGPTVVCVHEGELLENNSK